MGLGARRLRYAEINFQFARKLGDDFFEEGVFVHCAAKMIFPMPIKLRP